MSILQCVFLLKECNRAVETWLPTNALVSRIPRVHRQHLRLDPKSLADNERRWVFDLSFSGLLVDEPVSFFRQQSDGKRYCTFHGWFLLLLQPLNYSIAKNGGEQRQHERTIAHHQTRTLEPRGANTVVHIIHMTPMPSLWGLCLFVV